MKTLICTKCKCLDVSGIDGRNVYMTSLGEVFDIEVGGLPMAVETAVVRIDEGDGALMCDHVDHHLEVTLVDRWSDS